MKGIHVYGILCAIIMICGILAGCTDSSDDDDDGDKELISKGNTLVYKLTESEMGTATMEMKITSDSSDHNGQDVIILEITVEYEPYYNEDSETYYGDSGGTGTVYLRTIDFGQVYIDSELTIKGREDPGDEWSTTIYDITMSRTITGTLPEELKTGVNYTLEETISDDTKILYNGSVVMDETDSYSETIHYEVLGEKEVTVPAGTFTCWEIKVYTEGLEDEYTLRYFAPELNADVKRIEHIGGEESGTEVLESYTM